MAYAAASDVQALIGALFTIGSTSTPTTTQVSGWIDQYSAEVDGVLSERGYGTIPATGTTDLLILKNVVAKRTAAETYFAAFGFDDSPANVEAWMADYNGFLAGLRNGDRKLVNQNERRRAGVVYLSRYIED